MVAMTTKTTAMIRTTMMIVAVSDLSSMVGVVGLGLVVEEVDSPAKTIAVIPSTRLMYSSSLPCENYKANLFY